MTEVVPAILPESYEDLSARVSRVRGLVRVVQIDIADGSYAPTETWPFSHNDHWESILHEDEGLPFWEDIEYEVDMLVKNPEQYIDDWAQAGVTAAIIHIESTESFESVADVLHERNISVGVGISPSTDIENLEPLIEHIDFIQCMGNDEIGRNGVALDERVYDKVRMLREMYPNMPIAVDIGVNEETAPLLVEAGATKLVSGSAIFGSADPKETITALESLG
ncbi:MAG: tryptophan synthase subunit alpha [Patescibacteria group bacterium]